MEFKRNIVFRCRSKVLIEFRLWVCHPRGRSVRRDCVIFTSESRPRAANTDASLQGEDAWVVEPTRVAALHRCGISSQSIQKSLFVVERLSQQLPW